MGSQLYALPHTATASSHNMRATLLLGNVTRNLARARLGADVSKTRALLVCQKQLQIESDSLRRTLVTSATRFSDDKKASDQASLAMKIDPKEAAARKAAEEATKKALEKKRIEDEAAAKKEEKASATKAEAETLKKEKEAKLKAEKLKKEQEAKAAGEKKKKEEEARVKAEKLKKEQEAKAAAEKKRRKKRPELRLRNSRR